MFSSHDLERVALRAGTTSDRTSKVGEHLLSTYWVPDTITLLTSAQFILPSTLKKKVVFFDLRGLSGVVTGQGTIHSVRRNVMKEQAQTCELSREERTSCSQSVGADDTEVVAF